MQSKNSDISGCEICGSSVVLTAVNHDRFSGEYFQIFGCSKCNHGRTAFHDWDTLGMYYPEAYYGGEKKRFIPLIEIIAKACRSKRAKRVRRLGLDRSNSILDHGCGRGHMLDELSALGWRCSGTEFTEGSAEEARVRGIHVVTTDLGRNPLSEIVEKYGVVTAWHVLEHVKSPREDLFLIRDLLEAKGRLLLEVPNWRSIQGMIDQGTWIYTESPRHISHFSKESLICLLEQCGFSVLNISTSSTEYGFFGMIQSLLNVFVPNENHLFLLLRGNHESAEPDSQKRGWWFSTLLTLILILPLAIIGVIAELVAISLGKGGVLRVIAQKNSDINALT